MKPKPLVVAESLKSLSTAVRKHLQRLTDALRDPDLAKREKAVARLLKMLELANDNAMLQGLGLSFAKITQLKSANLKVKAKSELTKETSPHHDLIRFAEQKACGTLPNYAAAAACVKWLLEAGFDPCEVKDCWGELEKEKWRGAITLFTVRANIGSWKANRPRTLLELVPEKPKTAAGYIAEIGGVKSDSLIRERIAAIKDEAIRAEVQLWHQNQERRTG